VDESLHPLLRRQLRRLGIDPTDLSAVPPAWGQLLERVSNAYGDVDQERYLLERSQNLASREMGALYADLKASQARLSSLVSLSSDWLWEQDAQLRFTYISPHVAASGVDVAGMMGCTRGVRQLPAVTDSDPDDFEARVAAHEPFRDFTYGVRLADGRPFYVRVSGEPVFENGQFTGYRGVGSDVTKATLAEQQVLHMARFDSLTGLANRSMFLQELDRVLASARGSDRSFAVLFIDLDRFKNINDTLGHDAGDDLLKVMAARLSGLLRGADMVARLGGDEFVVLVDGCAEPAALSKVASRVLNVLCEPMRVCDRSVQVSGSVGISVYPADGADAATLLKSADTAMYQAKASGKNNFQFFTPQLALRAAQHFALEGDLRQALARGELRLHYQPKFELSSGRLCGMEALIRWQHPQRGLLSPGHFIELAEESGLIVPMGRWVMEETCRQLRQWREDGLDPPRCAINLSVRQFSSDSLAEDLRVALAVSALESDVIEVEITESLLMSDPERAQRTLQVLHEMGVRIAIDDFGTGYSSLAYLKRFPAHTLKIDRSFVKGLPDDRDDCAITQAVIAMAHSLSMEVVAEGVETESQLNFLRRLGCDQAQGFLLGRPVPAHEIATRLQDVRSFERAA
jgi:diguanylate cyclase (GGDEF)-like protein/PAS domain S-box-containing protein